MSQTSVSRDSALGFAGMKADSRFDHVESMQAYESISFGLGLVKRVGYDNQVRLPKQNSTVVLFDADLVTSNTIDLSVNGTAITQVTFATDHDATMALLVTAIELLDDVSAVTLTDATDNRALTIVSIDGLDAVVTGVSVLAGGSQAGSTVTEGTSDTIYGISVAAHTQEQTSAGIVVYAATEAVNVLRQGACYVTAEEVVTSDNSVFVRFNAESAKVIGQFRNDADTDKAVAFTGAKYKQTITAAGIVVVEINLP